MCSLLASLNVKTLQLIEDISSKKVVKYDDVIVQLNPEDLVYLDVTDDIVQYRASSASTLVIGIGGACSCLQQKNPEVIRESISATLAGLKVTTSDNLNSKYRLKVEKINRSYGLVSYDLSLYENGNRLNHRSIYARQYFNGEQAFLATDGFTLSSVMYYALNSTFWLPFVQTFEYGSSNKPNLQAALSSMLKVSRKPKVTEKNDHAQINDSIKSSDVHLMDAGAMYKSVFCEDKQINIAYSGLYNKVLIIRGNRYPLAVEQPFEALVCIEDKLFILDMPSNDDKYFKIYQLNEYGSIIRNTRYEFDAPKWTGEVNRKPLVYISMNNNIFTLGILDFNGRNNQGDVYFYDLKAPSP
jgi:hypothetical protein